MLVFEEARKTLVSMAQRVPTEAIPLAKCAGRILARDLLASRDMPAFDHSSFDGFAVRISDFDEAGPWILTRTGESRAGRSPGGLPAGGAMRIFTGAPIPAGADTVVMQERTSFDDARVTFHERPSEARGIRKQGDDLLSGATLLPRGTRIGPRHIALAASFDIEKLEVHRRPRVTILATGDELRRPGAKAEPHTIADSITDAIALMVERTSAIPTVLPLVEDDLSKITDGMRDALHECDLLITVGGVSVGDYDFVTAALKELDVPLEFWKVAIKPGKPLMLARRGATTILGLPGNPVSALVTFGLFGVPHLLALQGAEQPYAPPIRAQLTRDYAHEPGRLEFARVVLSRGDTGNFVTPASNQASGALVSLALSGGLMEVPLESHGLRAGDNVAVHLLSDLALS